MGAWVTYSVTPTDIQINANVVKEMVIGQLAHDGLIKHDDPNKLLQQYAVVVVKKGWLGRMVDKFFFTDKEDDGVKLAMVKVCRGL